MDKQKLGLVIFLTVAGATVLYYFYQQGKKSAITQANLPPDLSPSGGTESNSNLEVIATAMQNDMAGLNLFGEHDEAPYQQALALSNTAFVQLYNIFNDLYQQSSSQTLTQWINAESYEPWSAWEAIQKAMIDRLASLNLP